jgi:cob(I)alamin adenosyltransferase
MNISSGKGDDGYSDLLGGRRFPKNHPIFEALGSIDEAQSAIGMVRSSIPPSDPFDKILEKVQKDLALAMVDIADQNRIRLRLTDNAVREIEREISTLERELPPLREFIIPSGPVAATTCFWARTVVRRAERGVAGLMQADQGLKTVLVYLNRVGDFLFLVGRKLSG